MRMKFIFCFVLFILLFRIDVNAQSYNMILNSSVQEVEKGSIVDIYITLDNINGIPDGLNACMFNLEYDSSKIEIITNNDKLLLGQNGWDGVEGENIVWDKKSGSSTTKTNIAQISAKILDSSSITIKNIECSDGQNDISADANTLFFTIKQAQQDNVVNNNNNNNDNYNSSDTVESSETGVKELSIVFILVAMLSLIIKKVVSRRDLFKKF